LNNYHLIGFLFDQMHDLFVSLLQKNNAMHHLASRHGAAKRKKTATCKSSGAEKKDQRILFRRAKEGNPFKFLVFEAGAVIPAKHISQHQIESPAPCVELLCGGAAAPELIW
jgi:hypothetical protein